MRRSFALLFGVAGAVLALDQWTKHWASRTLVFHPPIELIDGFARLTYTRNSGIAFGLGAGARFPYYIFSIVAAVAILYLFLRHLEHGFRRQLALSLILGGALGNLIDRISTGEVVDFIEIGVGRFHWPVFNVADSAVTIGVVLFALTWSRRREPLEATPGVATSPDLPTSDASGDDPHARTGGPGAERGGAAGPLSRGDARGPLA